MVAAPTQPCPAFWPLVFASIPHGNVKAAAEAWHDLNAHMDNCPACTAFERSSEGEEGEICQR